MTTSVNMKVVVPPAGKVLNLISFAPVAIDATTDKYATNDPKQWKTLFAAGLYWAFYNTGSQIVFKTSSDGSTWSAATPVCPVSGGYQFCIFFDGTYIHYARGSSTIFYRRGIPQSNGTIAWSATEQQVATGIQVSTVVPMVAVDSGGFPWISVEGSGTTVAATIYKSSTNDGTWVTASGFPKIISLSGYTSNNFRCGIAPLLSGKMIVFMADSGVPLVVSVWDGSTFGSPISSSALTYPPTVNVVTLPSIFGNKAFFSFLDNNNNIIFQEFDADTGVFTSPFQVQSSATTANTSGGGIALDPSSGDIYISWWDGATEIFLRRFDSANNTWVLTNLFVRDPNYNSSSRLAMTKLVNGATIPMIWLSSFNVAFSSVKIISPV